MRTRAIQIFRVKLWLAKRLMRLAKRLIAPPPNARSSSTIITDGAHQYEFRNNSSGSTGGGYAGYDIVRLNK